MGCCGSRPTSDTTTPVHNPAAQSSSSRNNLTAPSTRPSSIPSPRASHASQGGQIQPQTSRHRSSNTADDRPNAPLKAIPPDLRARLPATLSSPTSTSQSNNASTRIKPLSSPSTLWTPSRLAKERQDWWDTQVTGRAEIWGAVRLAVEYLQKGEVEQAQTMLDVTGCTCPSGVIWKGVYDATGVQYRVPEWVVVECEGVVPEGTVEWEDGVSADEVRGKSVAVSAVAGYDGEAKEEDNGNGEVRRIKVRPSHDQRDVLVSIKSRETISSIVEKVRKGAKLDVDTRVRLAYGGRLYQDFETLEAHPYWNFANEHVLTALVTPTEP